MAAGLPIVSTPLGVEELGLSAGRHYLEGATPAALGVALGALLASGDRGTAMASAARERAMERHSRDAVALLQERLCASVAAPG